MARIVLRAVAFLIAAAVVTMPVLVGLVPTGGSTGPDPVSITDYDATFTIDANGSLEATERLTATFPFGRHGIFRYWDLRDPSDDHVRLTPRNIEVSLDGQDEPFELLWENGRRFRVAKIGDADRYVSSGTHVYTISYRIEGALSPATAGQGAFASTSWTDEQPAQSVYYWNVVAPGWGMTMDRSTVTINLPEKSGKVQCTTGFGTAVSPSGTCEISGGGTPTVTVETGALAARTPVTVRVGLPVKTPDRHTVPWPIGVDRALGRSLPAVVIVALVTVAAVAAGYVLD
ncbi:MAG: DUF2207 domain-containing protein, partial [Aeromicrobium sp.]